MAGWQFIIEKPTRIAEWPATIGGMSWINELVKEKKAISLGGDGYPYKFKAMAKHLKSIVLGGPPDTRYPWISDDGDISTRGWKVTTTIDRKAWEKCDPDEWLSIEVWDDT